LNRTKITYIAANARVLLDRTTIDLDHDRAHGQQQLHPTLQESSEEVQYTNLIQQHKHIRRIICIHEQTMNDKLE
jgi:hypothetical protein